MKRAISQKDVVSIGKLAEEDTLNLHAVTMTGKEGLILLSPRSIEIIREARRLRAEEDLPVWFSLDTGPSVFVNTTRDAAQSVRRNLSKIAGTILVSDPGGPAEIIAQILGVIRSAPVAFDHVVLHPVPNPTFPDDPERGYTARVAREILPAVRSALEAPLTSNRRDVTR